MTNLTTTAHALDFSPMHAMLSSYVDRELLAGVSSAVLKGQDLLDLYTTGKADIDGEVDLRVDHIFRAYSNTKLMTSIAVLMLFEDGKLDLDDPIEKWIPKLANRKVLKSDARDASDVVDAERPISVRHLLSHSSGLNYGLFDPGTVLYGLYQQAGVNDASKPLSAMVDALADLPLSFQPGTSWQYSVATDLLGHLVEHLCEKSLEEVLDERIWQPLGMIDTGFHVPEEKRGRFARIYMGADLAAPMKPGLSESPGLFPGSFDEPPMRQSGGGGLTTTLPDMIALMRSFLPGGRSLLKPETTAEMMRNQLPDGVCINFAGIGEVPGLGFGLGGAVKLVAKPGDTKRTVGEFHWGGVAGTHWWINPTLGVAGLNMTQREMGFWHPFSAEHKAEIYKALG